MDMPVILATRDQRSAERSWRRRAEGRFAAQASKSRCAAIRRGRLAAQASKRSACERSERSKRGTQALPTLITTKGSPSFTTSPAVTTTSDTEPATSASTGISIFIDSKITTGSSADTVCPTSTSTFITAATSSATTVWLMRPS
jgi:hypothetical protein